MLRLIIGPWEINLLCDAEGVYFNIEYREDPNDDPSWGFTTGRYPNKYTAAAEAFRYVSELSDMKHVAELYYVLKKYFEY